MRAERQGGCVGLGGQALPNASRRLRARFLFSLGIAWVLVVAIRLSMLQFAKVEVWETWARKQHRTSFTLASVRGTIYDREGQLLALSVPASSIYAHPAKIKDKRGAAQKLAPVLGISEATLFERLSKPDPFVWLSRQAPLDHGKQVASLVVPGVGFFHESRRVYPRNHAGSTLIGRVGIDGSGLSGLERQFDKKLRAQASSSAVYRDAMGNLIHAADEELSSLEVPEGSSLELTLDAEFQDILQQELDRGKVDSKAKAAVGALIDARTGEILAMTQSPSSNFNDKKISSASLHNLVAEMVLEPGSVMKPLVAAAALQEGLVGPSEIIDCERGRYRFGRHVIKDVHPISLVPFYEVVVRSSNIGMTKIGERLGKARLHDYLRAFGFGRSSGLGFPGESAGILRDTKRWADVDVATHSFGQGIAVTPLQMVRAVAVVANGGMYRPLTLVRGAKTEESQRVLSSPTARLASEMMRGVVEHEKGTGHNARIPGVRVGGKTGTAQKARPGGRGYEPGNYFASFVGYVEADSLGIGELYTLVISVDEPKGGSIYGGMVAAPIFKRTMTRILNVMATRRELDGRSHPKPLLPQQGQEVLFSKARLEHQG